MRAKAGGLLAAVALLLAVPALAADHTFTAGPVPNQYESADVTIDQGDTITFKNSDSAGASHDVTADAMPDGKPIFKSEIIDKGKSGPVNGVEFLRTGDYTFHCSLHNFMKGTLHVTANGTPKTAPPPDTTPPDVRMAILDTRIGKVLARKALRVKLTADEAARFKMTAISGRTTLGKATASLAAAGSRTAQITLTKAGRKLFAKSSKLTIKLKAAVNDAANNATAATTTRRLKR